MTGIQIVQDVTQRGQTGLSKVQATTAEPVLKDLKKVAEDVAISLLAGRTGSWQCSRVWHSDRTLTVVCIAVCSDGELSIDVGN